MSLRTIIVLLIILFVLVGLAVWQRERQTQVAGPAAGSPVLPGLDINAIHRVEIAAGNSTSIIERQQGRWVVQSLYGYPADFEKVVEALRRLSDLEIGQIIRDADEYPAEFGLAGGASSTRVILHGAAPEPVTLVLGDTKQDKARGDLPGYDPGRYLRTPDGRVVLAGVSLHEWTAASEDWIGKNLLNLSIGEIEQIRVAAPDGEYTLLVKGAGQFELAGAAEGETAEPGAASRLVNGFNYLRCDTVADPAAGADHGFDAPARCVVRTKDHREYTLLVGGFAPNGGRYLQLAVTYNEPQAPSEEDVAKEFPPEEKTEPADGEPETAPKKSREEKIREELDRRLQAHQKQVAATLKIVESQAAAWSGWTFVVPGYMAETLALPRESVVKKPAAPEESGQPVDGGPADGP